MPHKTGYKNVQAYRYWHGTFGFTSEAANCKTNLCPDGSGYTAFQPIPDQTKYLTITYDMSFSDTFDPSTESGPFTGSLSGSRTVNQNTGEVTSNISSQCSLDSGSFGTLFVCNNGAFTNTDNDTGTVLASANHGGGTPLDSIFIEPHCGFPAIDPRGPTFTLDAFVQSWNGGGFAGADPTSNPFTGTGGLPDITDPNNYIGESTGTLNAGATTYHAKLSFTRTNTSVTWDFLVENNFDDSNGPLTNVQHFSGSITLSNPWTAAQVYADVNTNLLSLWPLDDDELYPWRPDTTVGVAPLVIRNEFQNPVNPIGFNPFTVDDLRQPIKDPNGNAPFSSGWVATYQQMNWFDPDKYGFQFATGASSSTAAAVALIKLYDGSIVGAPLDAGHEGWWDYYFNDFKACCFNDGSDPQVWDFFPLGWGTNAAGYGARTGAHLPPCSTHWTNPGQALGKPEGAFIFYADQNSYVASGCPSAESNTARDSGALWCCSIRRHTRFVGIAKLRATGRRG